LSVSSRSISAVVLSMTMMSSPLMSARVVLCLCSAPSGMWWSLLARRSVMRPLASALSSRMRQVSLTRFSGQFWFVDCVAVVAAM
jgi:hypothetical protein